MSPIAKPSTIMTFEGAFSFNLRIFFPSSYISIIEIYDEGKKIRKLKEKAPSNVMMVDGFAIGDIQEVVIRDRKMLAEDGMFVIVASINTKTGKLKKSP